MYDLQTTDWLREIQSMNFGAKVTVEDALGNKVYFKLLDIRIGISADDKLKVTIEGVYTGEDIKSK